MKKNKTLGEQLNKDLQLLKDGRIRCETFDYNWKGTGMMTYEEKVQKITSLICRRGSIDEFLSNVGGSSLHISAATGQSICLKRDLIRNFLTDLIEDLDKELKALIEPQEPEAAEAKKTSGGE